MAVWYFPVVAAAIFAIFALNSIEEDRTIVRVLTGVLVVVIAASMAALVGRITFNRPGYKNIRVAWGPTIVSVLAALLFPVGAVILAPTVGSWVWIAAGAGLAALILIVGVPYQRKHRRG